MLEGCRYGSRESREERRGRNRSRLIWPVIVDQPEISRAEERRNWAMLIAPKGSKGGRANRSPGVWERKWRIASVSVVDEVEDVDEVS